MTLIITAINGACVVQVSDRLTTVKARNSEVISDHDPCANKTIVYVARDGYMSISFAGIAYVGTCPTDDWLAIQLAGAILSAEMMAEYPCLAAGASSRVR